MTRSLRLAAAAAAVLLVCAAAWAADFSGKYQLYEDDFNGFRLKIPVEFQQSMKGATTEWTGPLLNGMACGISVNVVEMPGVPPKVLYDTNLQSKKQDRFYVEVEPVKVKFGDQEVYAFRCKESNNQRGTRDEKAPGDHHRWHLFVFGNGRFYTCGFSANYQTFKQKRIQPVFEEVIGSFELIEAKP